VVDLLHRLSRRKHLVQRKHIAYSAGPVFAPLALGSVTIICTRSQICGGSLASSMSLLSDLLILFTPSMP